MPKIKLVIEFNGARFNGWQAQAGNRSIQAELERALTLVTRESPLEVVASGRTDSGVHARAQVVHVVLANMPDLEKIKVGVSGVLKGEVSVLAAEVVEDSFHARFSAHWKHYRYTIMNRVSQPTLDRGFVWYVPNTLDIPRMQAAAQSIVGLHNFKCFQAAGCAAKTTERRIFVSTIRSEPPFLYYDVIGTGFLKQMVRNIVGSLVEIGKGSAKFGSFAELIANADRKLAGPTAPAQGLCLIEVGYAPFDSDMERHAPRGS
jgi:tRNA pseudouridine38-40 synthase